MNTEVGAPPEELRRAADRVHKASPLALVRLELPQAVKRLLLAAARAYETGIDYAPPYDAATRLARAALELARVINNDTVTMDREEAP